MAIKKLLQRLSLILLATLITFVLLCMYIPQRDTGNDDIMSMPVFEDLTYDNQAYIETVYMNGIMSYSGGGKFGADKILTTNEAAYISVWIHEWKNHMDHSFESFNPDSDEYINKALEYGIWPQINKKGTDEMTRYDLGAVLARYTDESMPDVGTLTEFAGMEKYPFHKKMMQLYNKGIALSTRITDAYSKEKKITRVEAAQIVTMILSPVTRLTELAPDYRTLEEKLTDMMKAYEGDWSLYFEEYETGEKIVINSHQVYSASLIKLFVIQSIYKQISDGTLKNSAKIEDWLTRMITYSDNDSWSSLARKLGKGSYSRGMAYVTETAAASGFKETGHFKKGKRKNYNFTSVEDCGNYLRMVLNGQIVSAEYSKKILDLMKQQQLRHKIPSGVPENVKTANKTGELEYMQGDAAIVYAPSGTYILVVIGDELTNIGMAQEQIRQLSRTVYEHFN